MRYRIQSMAAALMLCGAGPVWAADADTTACSGPDQPLRPVMATHTQPPYPPMSVMTSEQGTTLVKVSIGPDGVPTGIAVVKSSGSLRLDQATMDHIKDNWRWNAPVKSCKPVAAQTEIQVTWNLRDASENGLQPPTIHMNPKDYPPEALQKREQGTVGVMVFVSALGQVVPVVTQSSGFADLDQRTIEVTSGWHWTTGSLEGRPMNTAFFFNAQWKPDSPH